jgi:hypothetical protein
VVLFWFGLTCYGEKVPLTHMKAGGGDASGGIRVANGRVTRYLHLLRTPTPYAQVLRLVRIPRYLGEQASNSRNLHGIFVLGDGDGATIRPFLLHLQVQP